MTSASELISIYEAPRPEAEVIAAFLRSSGIHTTIFGGLETAAHPSIGGPARVMVRAEDARKARRLIEEKK
jgi:hypothetical protein